MIATITPSVLNGTITAPASKSAMQRACALALLNKGETVIYNPGTSNDDLVAINIIRQLGAIISRSKESIVIRSAGKINAKERLDCGESGLSLRMFAPIAALSNSTVILNGTGTLLKRSMHLMDEIFPMLNVKITSNNGFLPISVTGPLIPKNISIDGSLSSQYLTGLLIAFAKAAVEPVTIHVSKLKSKPYIDLSLQLLQHFGYEVINDNYESFHITPVVIKEKNISYNTEADWSNASFMLVAGAIAGTVTVDGLDIHSVQADKAIINVLTKANADIVIANGSITVSNKNILRPFEFDATDCPDLFPPLTVLAAYCKGTSLIHGVSRLVAKESNRADTLSDSLSKMGIAVNINKDTMIINGGTGTQGANVSSHHDHRIAMACAIAALGAKANLVIHDAGAVNKSWPRFYEDFKMLGASLSLSQE